MNVSKCREMCDDENLNKKKLVSPDAAFGLLEYKKCWICLKFLVCLPFCSSYCGGEAAFRFVGDEFSPCGTAVIINVPA